MVMVAIPSMAEIGTGISLVTNGACELAPEAVQQFVTSPSIAQAGLNALAAQIEVLEQLVAKLRHVATGIETVQGRLGATLNMEWHSPAGEAFRIAVGERKVQAQQLESLTLETVQLAHQGIDELRTFISSLQSLLSAARATMGDVASGAVAQVCS